MLTSMQRHHHPEGSRAESQGAGSSSSPSTSKGEVGVSFWSSHSVVDSLFSDDPPTRLGQTLSADQASLFIPHQHLHQNRHNQHHHHQDTSNHHHLPRWAPRRGGGGSGEPSSADTDADLSSQLQHIQNYQSAQQLYHHQQQQQQQNQYQQQNHQHLGSLSPQRSSFDEGNFYSGSSLFSTSPILSPPASPSPAISILFSPGLAEDFNAGGSASSHGGGNDRPSRHHHHHHGQLHHSHSGSFTMPRKHSHPLHLGSSPSSSPGSSSSNHSGSKYTNPRPSASGLPNGAGHKQSSNAGAAVHYSNGVGATSYSHQLQQFANNPSGAYGFRSSPPRSSGHVGARGGGGSSGALSGGSGGYPIASSHPRQLRANIGGSSPRSSPPRQAHSFLSTALNGSGNGLKSSSILAPSSPANGGHQGLNSKSTNNISSLYHPTSGNNNICYDEEAPSAVAILGASPGHALGLTSSSAVGASRPIQIARSSSGRQQQLAAGGSMGPRSISPLNSYASSLGNNGSIGGSATPSPLEDEEAVDGEEGEEYSDNYDETSSVLLLPSTILQHIFSYLSGRDLGHLEQVCRRRLSFFANDDELWKDLYLRRYKLLDLGGLPPPAESAASTSDRDEEGSESDEWAWIYSLLHQKERWKDIYKTRFLAEQWRIGSLKMFNGCWGFISQTPTESAGQQLSEQMLDIFFHRKDIAPDGEWYEDWWLKDTPGVSRSQKCSYWDTFLCGRIVRYKQRAAYAQGRRPQACNISFVGEERRDPVTGEPLPALHDAKIAQRSLASRSG